MKWLSFFFFNKKKNQNQTELCKICGEAHEPEDDQGNPWHEYACQEKVLTSSLIQRKTY